MKNLYHLNQLTLGVQNYTRGQNVAHENGLKGSNCTIRQLKINKCTFDFFNNFIKAVLTCTHDVLV